MRRRLWATLAALVLGMGFGAQAAPLTVTTPSGVLQGEVSGGVASFKGVPFAAPPVGPLRWRPPEPAAPWTGVREATAYGATCAQGDFGWNSAAAKAGNEDCLTLNIWVPQKPRSGPLPVIVFFHGGAYHGGSPRGLSSMEPSYDGSRLARRGVIVVTAHYRLGLFGFLADPGLTAESPHHASGNYALMDNIAALAWVKSHIAAFGGDPDNVTALGQSAGSASVGLLMTSPLAKGLFQKAVLHSGSVFDVIHTDPLPFSPRLQEAEASGHRLAVALGGSGPEGVAALRQVPAAELIRRLKADPTLSRAEPRSPVVDGYVLPEDPAVAFAEGREAKIPMIIGYTARDGDLPSMGVSGSPKAAAAIADPARPLAERHRIAPLSADQVKDIETFYAPYGGLAPEARRLYRDLETQNPEDGDAYTAFQTDLIFRCGAALAGELHARRAPTWRYQFSHGYEPLGATHIWDMIYLFGWLQPPADQPRDVKLSDAVQTYWVNFARTGNPNGAGLAAWPGDGPRHGYLDFASQGPVAGTGPRQGVCTLFAQKTQADLAAFAKAGPRPQP
jgi:para-nitrobenzyl esterase